MHPYALLLAAAFLPDTFQVHAKPIIGTQSTLQVPLDHQTVTHPSSAPSRRLHGRFLHITDLHPDPHYKVHSSTSEDDACHRGSGTAGAYGAETSDCDTPFALINATFKWIKENVRDNIDFVVWTGDSARHDSDESIPRNADEVLSTNRWIASKFLELFCKDGDPKNDLTIPIVSTFGNNDILPHNILLSGPNKWLKTYTNIWSKFIPEEQRHGFERGGWYYVEVIPNKLAIFSLNTLYFFTHNAAVDGCALRSEPGYEHMEWLRIQLQFMRDRGMKVILTGHVPPARTESKQLWDETCWQKYTLWLKQYRDVVIGGLYGHMNIDHFMLQDTKEVDLLMLQGLPSTNQVLRATMDEELTIESANDYLEELRENWSDLPNPKAALKNVGESSQKSKKTKKEKALKKMGGPWGERYHVTLVGPSIVPNFLPTLRVIEYNTTGLEDTPIWGEAPVASEEDDQLDWFEEIYTSLTDDLEDDDDNDDEDDLSDLKKKKKKGKKHHKKPSNPDLIIPDPPTRNSPPGPAYSPQTLTLLGYTQYFANLTHINNDFVDPESIEESGDEFDADKWHKGKHHGKHPKDKAKPKPFQYQVEYDTFTDPIYKLKDLTVRSYIKLAHRIGQYKPLKGDEIDEPMFEFNEDDAVDEVDAEGHGKKHKNKKHHRQHEKNKVWLRFIKRAFVGTLEDEDLQSFESKLGNPKLRLDEWRGDHEGEL